MCQVSQKSERRAFQFNVPELADERPTLPSLAYGVPFRFTQNDSSVFVKVKMPTYLRREDYRDSTFLLSADGSITHTATKSQVHPVYDMTIQCANHV